MSIAPQDFTRFMNDARVGLPGSSDAGIKQALFTVLFEFFRDSSAWVERQDFITVQDQTVYSMATDEGLTVKLAGVLDANNMPVPAIMTAIDEITLRDKPTGGQTFSVFMAKNVKLPTNKDAVPLIPEWVMPQYHVTILDGVLGRMMLSLKKSYTDQTLGNFYWKRFRDGIAMARVATLRRYTFGTQAWVFPGSFSGGTQRGGVSVGNDVRFT